MQNRNSKFEFTALLFFLVAAGLLLSDGFQGRIDAQTQQTDVYQAVEPIGVALNTVIDQYVLDVDVKKLVQGSLSGLMSSLDRNSSFISTDDLKSMREDTQGEFEGIGVSIKMDEQDRVMVHTPILDSPAQKAGILPFDYIIKIDGVAVNTLWKYGMTASDKLSATADKIRGRKGTTVKLTILRRGNDGGEEIELVVKRDKVPLESLKEARLLPGKVGYARVSDFKETTAADLRKRMEEFLKEGMVAFVLDLRGNPGGLLESSKAVSELFLPRNSLVVYTKGRPQADGSANRDDQQLHTEVEPILPAEIPVAILVNEMTASAAEIVTGALQFHERAVVVGEKTFGKGSVQTIIPLLPERESALRLTTALYYTPANVTIDHQGILPDVETPMSIEEETRLYVQMYKSYDKDPTRINAQNHGAVSGDPVKVDLNESEAELKLIEDFKARFEPEAGETMQKALKTLKERYSTIEDTPLKRAVEIVTEAGPWSEVLKKYHKDVHVTQTAAGKDAMQNLKAEDRRLIDPNFKDSGEGKKDAPAPAPTKKEGE